MYSPKKRRSWNFPRELRLVPVPVVVVEEEFPEVVALEAATESHEPSREAIRSALSLRLVLRQEVLRLPRPRWMS